MKTFPPAPTGRAARAPATRVVAWLAACLAAAALAMVTLLVPGAAAQQPTPPDSAGPPRSGHRIVRPASLDTVVTRGRLTSQVGIAASASQGAVGASDLALRPLLRPAEVVENVPGVIVTQHSGSGKANQYFLRGFNLDHGTDLALSVDDVPVNMPTHAHGQGYADLNFLIPELIDHVDFQKGPYFADVGDFGSAGAFTVHYYDRLPYGIAHAEGGQVGYGRALVADNAPLADGNLLYAGEFEHNDGPWAVGDNERKLDGVARYARGDARSGFAITAMAYHNVWRATDQVPDRAITEGLIGRYGEIDPSDGGSTGRYALTGDWHDLGGHSLSRATIYAVRYDLDLFSNFTYFLEDPVHGDQIHQQDARTVLGGEVRHTRFGSLLGRPSQVTLGVQVRDDGIDDGLFHTEARAPLNAVTVDDITEANAGPFVETETRWTSWFRSTVGVRGDLFRFDVRNVSGGHSGTVQSGLLSPKAAVVLGPWAATELYLDAGEGFHSNDARGVVAATNPATPLPRSLGAELGVRTAAVSGLQSSISLWLLDLKSELVWNGDAGGNTPSGPTRRYGVELANAYTPAPWLTLDADYAWSHARFTDAEPTGPYVPEALVTTLDGGLAVHDLRGRLRAWQAGLRARYFGPRPLTQSDSVRSGATTLVYADVGYEIGARWTIGLDVFNVLNAHASDIDYFYVSRLRGEPAGGVADIHTHPAEPRALRLSVRARL